MYENKIDLSKSNINKQTCNLSYMIIIDYKETTLYL